MTGERERERERERETDRGNIAYNSAEGTICDVEVFGNNIVAYWSIIDIIVIITIEDAFSWV